MVKFEKAEQSESFLEKQRDRSIGVDYLDDVLKPALLQGDWEELEEMVIYKDDKITIHFKDDTWLFSKSNIKAKNVRNILFDIPGVLPKNVMRIKGSGRNLRNQIKCLILIRLYFSHETFSLAANAAIAVHLRNISSQMLLRGVDNFEDLSIELLSDWIVDGLDMTPTGAFNGLNALYRHQGFLPFSINYPKLNHKTFSIVAAKVEQYCVIPPRIYFAALNKNSDIINAAYAVRGQIKEATEKMISFEQSVIKRQIKRIRHGGSFKSSKVNSASFNSFFKALKTEGVPIADQEKNDRWMEIYNENKVNLKINSCDRNRFNVLVSGKKYTFASFREYIEKLSARSSWLCMALSGMRVDELWRMHPDFGAERKEFDKDIDESDKTTDDKDLDKSDKTTDEKDNDNKVGKGKEVIYFLHTRQSKISMNSQTKNDVFVTTVKGWKAFHVLNAIHSPFRDLFPKEDRNHMFAGLDLTQHPRALLQTNLGVATIKYFNKENFNLILTDKDMSYLNASDPTQQTFKTGDAFYFQNHQLRRSLAFYLIGYELCSFPALKQQLSHFSMAMTRWYARNASSLMKIYSEVQNERISQHADIFVRIYQKLANGERIAGGKGNAAMAEIARQGKSYFEEGANKRYLSREYWVESLRAGDVHLHVSAPGVVCTNTQCSMRINIDLSECVGCENDYIENVVYAESARMNAMRNLNFLLEMNDLNSNSASQYVMQIGAAEKIMKDLDFDFESFQVPQEVTQLLISTKNI